MKGNQPVPVLGSRQVINDGCHFVGGCDAFAERGGVEDAGSFTVRFYRCIRGKESIGFAPAGFIDAEITLLISQFGEIGCATGALRAVDVPKSSQGEMVVNRFDAFGHRIPVEDLDFDAGEERVDPVTGCDDGEGVIVFYLAEVIESFFSVLEQVRARIFKPPCGVISASAYLVL